MIKTLRMLVICTFLFGICLIMSGCAASGIDLNDYVEVEFTGYDMAGRASAVIDYERLIAENEKAFGLSSDSDEIERQKVYIAIGMCIGGALDENSGLSNGEIVNYEWNIDGLDSFEEKYKVTLNFSDLEIEVEGLEEPQALNPFDYISVSYEGIAPNGSIAVTPNDDIPLAALSFEADKQTGLRNGDLVTVTITANNLDTYALQAGYILSETEKTYMVEGLPYYAASINDIPEEAQQKMQKQAEDAINADCSTWETFTLEDMEFVGYYFLSAKEGFSVTPANEIYCVYKLTTNAVGLKRGGDGETTENGTEQYYTFYRYDEIMLLPDGTCSIDLSAGKLSDNRIESDYGYISFFTANFYQYKGYYDLDSMFSNCVTSKIEKYNYENTCF